MKHGIDKIELIETPLNNQPSLKKEELCKLVNELYAAFRNAEPPAIINNLFEQVNFYSNDKTLLEETFDLAPELMLKIAVLCGNNKQLLITLLNNKAILNKIDVHQKTLDGVSAFDYAFRLSNARIAHFPLLSLLEKFPLSVLLPVEIPEQIKNYVFNISVIEGGLSHPNLFSIMISQDEFRHFLIDKLNHDLNGGFLAALRMSEHNPELLEFILSQDAILKKISGLIRENPRLIPAIIKNVLISARKGKQENLLDFLEEIKNEPYNINLHGIVSEDERDELYSNLLLAAQQHTSLAAKINDYLIGQGADIEKLIEKISFFELENAIECNSLCAIKEIVQQNRHLNELPALSLAIMNAQRIALRYHTDSFEYETAFNIIVELIKAGCNVEAEYFGLTPLFHAINADVSNHTNITLLLLEKAKANINMQCTVNLDKHVNELSPLDGLTSIMLNEVSKDLISRTPLMLCLRKLPDSTGKNYITNLKRIIQTLLVNKPDLGLENQLGDSIKKLLAPEYQYKSVGMITEEEYFTEIFMLMLQQGFTTQEEMVGFVAKKVREWLAAAEKDSDPTIIKDAIKDLNVDFDVFFESTLVLSKYIIADSMRLPTDVISTIVDYTIYHPYKSTFQLRQDTENLIADFNKMKINSKRQNI